MYKGQIHALTRDWGSEARERATLCGCDGFLTMPFRQGALRRLLDPPQHPGDSSGATPDKVHRGTVLVAEDNAVNQLVTSRILQQLGYAVEIVSDGRAAVAAVENGRFDLVLMDCEMPEMDGFEAAAAIRSRPIEQIPIIALTAHAIKGYKELCLAAGMDGYISKPVRLGDLAVALERWMPSRPERVAPIATRK